MSVLMVTEQGAYIRKYGESLIVEKKDRDSGQKVRLHELELIHAEGLFLFGNIQFSTQALAMLMENRVDVSLFSSRGKLRGRIVPPKQKNITLRIRQIEAARKQDTRLRVAKFLLRRKLDALAVFARRRCKKAPHPEATAFLKETTLSLQDLDSVSEMAALLGVEGALARKFYSMIRALIRQPDFRFGPRRYHPPADEFNALLSFFFSLGTQAVTSLLEASGFDPYVGFLHSLRYGRVSLALDVLEAFRPELVGLALNMVNRRQLKPADFNAERNFFMRRPALKKTLAVYMESIEASEFHYRIHQRLGELREFLVSLSEETDG